MGFATKITPQLDRRFCGRCGKAWVRPSHPTLKRPGVTCTPRSHPKCKVRRERRLGPLLLTPRVHMTFTEVFTKFIHASIKDPLTKDISKVAAVRVSAVFIYFRLGR